MSGFVLIASFHNFLSALMFILGFPSGVEFQDRIHQYLGSVSTVFLAAKLLWVMGYASSARHKDHRRGRNDVHGNTVMAFTGN
jgi:4-hydroxybenzoate polyprenyltransferase